MYCTPIYVHLHSLPLLPHFIMAKALATACAAVALLLLVLLGYVGHQAAARPVPTSGGQDLLESANGRAVLYDDDDDKGRTSVKTSSSAFALGVGKGSKVRRRHWPPH